MKNKIGALSFGGVLNNRLSIEVTTRCNIDCTHCFARAGVSKTSSLPLEVAKRIIAEGYHIGYRHLHITGGEPLIWDELFEALDYAFFLGYQTVFLNTNGTLLTNHFSGKLAAYGGVSVSVSLEGSEALHDYMRGKDSYTAALQGIEKAIDDDIPLSIFTTACKSLLPELPNFADKLYMKFPRIKELVLIQLISPKNDYFPLSDELLEPEDLLQLIDTVSLLNLLGLRTRFLNNPLVCVAAKLLRILWVPHSEPLFSEGSMIVMANRDMRLSHSSRGNFGKYELGMIENVLASDGYRNAVAPDGKTCPLCKYFELCKESGMVRPSEGFWNTQSDVLYCQKVLDSAVA